MQPQPVEVVLEDFDDEAPTVKIPHETNAELVEIPASERVTRNLRKPLRVEVL